MVGCVVFGCTNRSRSRNDDDRKTGITFHRFPKNLEIRAKWIRSVHRKNWKPTKYSCICSEHFRPEDINRTSLSSVRIREGAIPSIFPTLPKYMQTNCEKLKPKRERMNCIDANEEIPAAKLILAKTPLSHNESSQAIQLQLSDASDFPIAMETTTGKKLFKLKKLKSVRVTCNDPNEESRVTKLILVEKSLSDNGSSQAMKLQTSDASDFPVAPETATKKLSYKLKNLKSEAEQINSNGLDEECPLTERIKMDTSLSDNESSQAIEEQSSDASDIAVALETVTEKKLFYKLKAYESKLQEKNKKLKAVRQANNRLKKKVAELEYILMELGRHNLINAECEHCV